MGIPYHKDGSTTPRHTGRGIVIKDGRILLIERWRDGLHYFSIPGGGIENDETAARTAEREVLEETMVRVTAGRVLYDMRDPVGHVHTFFMCEYVGGEPALDPDSEEAQSAAASHGANRYVPRWIPLQDVAGLTFMYWAPVGRQLVHDIEHGFAPGPKVLAAD